MASDGKYSVLIIDDDPVIRDTLVEFLKQSDYRVEAVADGESAIENFKESGKDVVILDLKLPGISGVEVMKNLKAMDPEAIIIIMTGFATLESAIDAIREGAYDYLTKPFKLDELRVSLRNACEKIALRTQSLEYIDDIRRKAAVTTSVTAGEDETVTDELERLAGLLEKGLITVEEYEVLKKSHLDNE